MMIRIYLCIYNFCVSFNIRSLLALKQELFELNKLTECAEEQLEQNMANAESLTSINITGIREKVVVRFLSSYILARFCYYSLVAICFVF